MVASAGLKLDGVNNVYETADGALNVLKDINCSILPEEIVFITGRNGSGKTTLIKAIAGEISYDGKITWQEETTGTRHKTHIENNVVWIPQNVNDIIADSVRIDELVRICDTEKVRSFAQREKLCWLFEKDTNRFIQRTMEYLSGGQRQLLIGAISLSKEGPIYLLDEVFSPLDTPTAEIYWRMLKDKISQANGVGIIVSHDLIFALKISDRIVVLNNGCIALDEKTKDIQLDDIFNAMHNNCNQ